MVAVDSVGGGVGSEQLTRRGFFRRSGEVAAGAVGASKVGQVLARVGSGLTAVGVAAVAFEPEIVHGGDSPVRLEKVKTNTGEEVSRAEYISRVIKWGQDKEVIKKQDAFKTKDMSGKEIDDVPKYDAYIDLIKERADAFNNPRLFGSFVSGLVENLDRKGEKSRLPVINHDDVLFIINSTRYPLAYDYLLKIKGGLERGASNEQARETMLKFLDELHEISERDQLAKR